MPVLGLYRRYDATRSREGKPAEAWYEAWIRFDDYRVFTVPADESGPSATGVTLRGVPFLRLRKVREPAPNGGGTEPMDLLAAIIGARKLLNNFVDAETHTHEHDLERSGVAPSQSGSPTEVP